MGRTERRNLVVKQRIRMSCDRTIETYIERLLAWKEPITAQTLDQLATEIGLSPDDMAAIHIERFHKRLHLMEGKGF